MVDLQSALRIHRGTTIWSVALVLSVPVLGTPAAGQTPPPVAPAGIVDVTFETAEGPLVIAVDTARAPITSANFLRYVDGKRFDGTSFYRAVKVTATTGLLQGGVNNDPKRLLKPIAHEPTSRTGLSHVDGAIAMARNAPGTAAGDFFIVVGGFPSMDASATDPGFAVFGHVVSGMEAVRHILAEPNSPTAGSGVAKGSMLADPVTILHAHRDS